MCLFQRLRGQWGHQNKSKATCPSQLISQATNAHTNTHTHTHILAKVQAHRFSRARARTHAHAKSKYKTQKFAVLFLMIKKNLSSKKQLCSKWKYHSPSLGPLLGLRFRVWRLGSRDKGLGFSVQCLGIRGNLQGVRRKVEGGLEKSGKTSEKKNSMVSS